MLAILRENETVPPVVGQRTGPPPRPLYSGFRWDGDGARMPEGQWARGGGYGAVQGPGAWGRARRRFGDGMLPRGEWRRGEDVPSNGDSGPGIGYRDDYRDRAGGGWNGGGRGRGGGGRGRDRW